MTCVALGSFRDVDREVADALEIGVDLDRRHDRAKVGGHRLVERQQLETAAVDFDVKLVDWLVAAEHGFDQIDVTAHKSVDRRANAFFRQTAHFEQTPLKRLELLLEMTYNP